ncbi:hypothetical protein PG993_008111 [Apiospora rasikravindrae]|uniref:F-box domain-containing protein n=1 Tax=Apiospora rasikravindrae TaxID=990691 RepID=A0ABR1SZF3_9PEZI
MFARGKQPAARTMAVEHTFPPELWVIICAELADQQDPRFYWRHSIREIQSARHALRQLCQSSKTLRSIVQSLLLRFRSTREERNGFYGFGENILSKPELAALVRGIEVAPCLRDASKEVPMLLEASNRLDLEQLPGLIWGDRNIPWRRFLLENPVLSPLVQLLPCFLPNLKYLHINIAPTFESITTLILEPAGTTPGGWVLQEYSPLLALLPNLRMLSLWKCYGILTEGLLYASLNARETIDEWMPKNIQSLHMRSCKLSSAAMTTLMANCHSLENFFYTHDDDVIFHRFPYTPRPTYGQMVRALRRPKNTLKNLDIDMGFDFSEIIRGQKYNSSEDLAEMWQTLREFPHVRHVSAKGKVYHKRDSEPFDWSFVKGYTGMFAIYDRTLDFQFALDQAMGF